MSGVETICGIDAPCLMGLSHSLVKVLIEFRTFTKPVQEQAHEVDSTVMVELLKKGYLVNLSEPSRTWSVRNAGVDFPLYIGQSICYRHSRCIPTV